MPDTERPQPEQDGLLGNTDGERAALADFTTGTDEKTQLHIGWVEEIVSPEQIDALAIEPGYTGYTRLGIGLELLQGAIGDSKGIVPTDDLSLMKVIYVNAIYYGVRSQILNPGEKTTFGEHRQKIIDDDPDIFSRIREGEFVSSAQRFWRAVAPPQPKTD